MTKPIDRAAQALYNSAQPSHDTEAHIVFDSIDVDELARVIDPAIYTDINHLTGDA